MFNSIVLATRNAHKLQELDRILKNAGVEVELLTVDHFPGAPEVDETEDSFEGNALLKARALATFTGIPAIADDSGLCVDALNGSPGILSARWSGASENVDVENMNLVLSQISETPEGQRGAQFVCAAAYVHPDGTEVVVRGTVEGHLLTAPRGTNGFGYDPIFVPNGFDITTAEMTSEQKDSMSHRSQALAKLVAQIPK